MTVSPPTLYWYQLDYGTLAPAYWGQLDTCVRSLCTENSVTLPTAPWYSPIAGTLNSAWILQIDTAVRALCTALSVTAPTGSPVGLIAGTLEASYYASLDAAVRACCDASGGYTGPLDLVPGAVVAYSAARALSAARIGQNVIKLRRDSDNATSIRVAAGDGSVDVAAAIAWRDAAGAATAFVDTLYDQSGNGKDFSASGVAQGEWSPAAIGGRPALIEAGDSYTSAGYTINNSYSFFAVTKGTNTLDTSPVVAGSMQITISSAPLVDLYNAGDNNEVGATFANPTPPLDMTAYIVWDGVNEFGNQELRGNNNVVAPISFDIAPPGSVVLSGQQLSVTDPPSPGCAEYLLYEGAKSAGNRTLVRNNQSVYYSIPLS